MLDTLNLDPAHARALQDRWQAAHAAILIVQQAMNLVQTNIGSQPQLSSTACILPKNDDGIDRPFPVPLFLFAEGIADLGRIPRGNTQELEDGAKSVG